MNEEGFAGLCVYACVARYLFIYLFVYLFIFFIYLFISFSFVRDARCMLTYRLAAAARA